MVSSDRIAVVTGANRGIGFEICRQLANKNFLVILTSRSRQKGRKACEELKREELPVHYYQLDVTSASSINKLGRFLRKEYGRCDVLINNAGIFLDTKEVPKEEFPSIFKIKLNTLRATIETNVYGPFLLCQELIPLMKENGYGRIVNLSSGLGQLSDMEGGYPGYRISKTAINTLTRILAFELKDENILVNSMCPGWVKTEMGGPEATRSVEEGADTAIWLATVPNGGTSGKFFRDRQEIPW